jgi:hypothetical protein
MKRKNFWQLLFLLLALINILIELRRDHTERGEFAYCEQLTATPEQKPNLDQARKSKTGRPNETVIIKQR